MASWTVADGTQVNLNGVVHGPGETFEATEEEVAQALRASWVAPAKATPAKKSGRTPTVA